MPDSRPVVVQKRRPPLQEARLPALLMGIYSLLPVWKESSQFHTVADVPAGVHAALGLVIGWLIVFRMNVSYNRWWEARGHWGALVNASRNLAVKASRLVRLPQLELEQLRRDLVAFPQALRDHLRDGASLERLPGYEQATDRPRHVPGYLVGERYAALGRWKAAGLIDGQELRVLDQEVSRLLEVTGACERIRQAYIAGAHRNCARQALLVLFIMLPWGIVNDSQLWTIPISMMTVYFLLGLEIIAERAEEPFGCEDQDINLDAICGSIEKTVGEICQRQSASGSLQSV